MKDIFDKYISGNEIIPFDKYLTVVGLKFTDDEEGNPLIVVDEDATLDAKRLREIYFNREVFRE
jgi:hypothetical protein